MQEYERRSRDPVCGRQVDVANPQLRTEYADVLYSFCSQQCMTRFLEQPDIFTAEPGRGNVAERDRGQRNDDLVGGELRPEAAAVVPTTPPAADPGG
jgi:YHS domain-containing protein